jgi:dihydroorotate dehydrogenase
MQTFLSNTTHYVYKNFLKPRFFLRDPEDMHNQNVRLGQALGKIAPLRIMVDWLWAYHNPVLNKTIDGITFPNPIGLSAGFDYNGKLTGILPSVGFGFHTIGTVTLHSYEGNPRPRLGRFPRSQALLVNKGLKNDGAEQVIKRLEKCTFQIPTGISIASTNKPFTSEKEQIEDIVECFKLFEKSKVKHAYYELNISCPNTFGGEPFTSAERLKQLMKSIDQLKLTRPLYVKMPIDHTQKETLAMLEVLARHNTHGVIFGNLTKDKNNPAVHPIDRKMWKLRKGNLSGKPTWERSNTLVLLTRKHFKDRFTIIGTGGVFSGRDARYKINFGADLIQLITGMIYEGPQVIGSINQYLAEK